MTLWLKQILSRIKYDYRLTVWLNTNRRRRIGAALRKHFDVIRRLAFVSSGLVLGVVITQTTSELTVQILAEYLLAIGIMAGSTIAIVFTISLFLVQNASNLYSSQYFDAYIHDWKEGAVYLAVILITIGLIGSGYLIGGTGPLSVVLQSWMVIISLVCVAVVFALIDWQYQRVRDKINPASAVAFLEAQGLKFLKIVNEDARKIAGVIAAGTEGTTTEEALVGVHARYMRGITQIFERDIETLISISLRLSTQHERMIAKRALTAACNVLLAYIDSRRSTSFRVPSAVALFVAESDSQAFLSRTYERLNRAAQHFIDSGEDELSTHVIDVYRALIARSAEIKFVGDARGDNPIVDQAIAYLMFLVESGQRAKNLEVVFQGARAVAAVPHVAAAKGLSGTLWSIPGRLSGLAQYGFAERQAIIVDNCTAGYVNVIRAVFQSDMVSREQHFANALTGIATIADTTAKLTVAGALPRDMAWWTTARKGYDAVLELLPQLMARYEAHTDEGERRRFRSDLVDFYKELSSSLRTLAESQKQIDDNVAHAIGDLLSWVNAALIEMLLRDDFQEERDEIERIVVRNVHLPTWFAHYASTFNSGTPAFDSLAESIAITGIRAAVRVRDSGIVRECVKALHIMATECLAKTTNRYGYDEPRIMVRLCYLGLIAGKEGWRDIVTEAGVRIYEFEELFKVHYLSNLPSGVDPLHHNVMGLPHHDQIFRELLRWRDDLGWRRPPGAGTAAELMADLVDRRDLDQFTFDVWGCLAADSEILEERRIARHLTSLLGLLVALQESRASSQTEQSRDPTPDTHEASNDDLSPKVGPRLS